MISLNVKQPVPFLTEQILRFRLKRNRITFPVLETNAGARATLFRVAEWEVLE